MSSGVVNLIFSHFPHQPTAGQQEACENLVRFLFDPDPHAAFMLKGYAGTGKTSLVSALIQTAPALRIRTLLLAPTGRAAKVLSGYSGRRAYTIHKKIYTTTTDSSGVIHTVRAQNKHSYTLFIVDEASMISDEPVAHGSSFASRTSLLEDLLAYVAEGNHCRLLLIGDAAQLPPVGSAESPALSPEYLQSVSDLRFRCSELTQVVRQDDMSGILRNATLLRNQISALEAVEASGCGDEVQLPLFDLSGCRDVQRITGGDLEELLNTEIGGGREEDVVVITRSNKRANLFNHEIRNRVLYREEEINAGDYLMVVRNNYFWLEDDSPIGFIANGDIVEVLSVRHREELYGFHFVEVTARFIDYPDAPNLDCKVLLETLHSESPALTPEESQRLFEEVMADYADLPLKADRLREVRNNPYYNALQVKFSYALTCHKTQGGQWPVVFLDQGYLTDDMLDKEFLRWLYTAFTRATEKVYLLNFEDRLIAGTKGEFYKLNI